jgi:ribosome maturation factor RimP
LFLAGVVTRAANIQQVIESTATGLGLELVDVEGGGRGGTLRVFIDHPVAAARTVTVEDCERLTRQLQRVFEVEGIDYGRLEVSSPGLDRVLKTPADFRRFLGATAEVRLRVPLSGRRRFVGVVREASDAAVELEVEGAVVAFEYANLGKARLVPKL